MTQIQKNTYFMMSDCMQRKITWPELREKSFSYLQGSLTKQLKFYRQHRPQHLKENTPTHISMANTVCFVPLHTHIVYLAVGCFSFYFQRILLVRSIISLRFQGQVFSSTNKKHHDLNVKVFPFQHIISILVVSVLLQSKDQIF